MRLRPSLALTAACLSLAACGGSAHSSTTHTVAFAHTSTAQASNAPPPTDTTSSAVATTSTAAGASSTPVATTATAAAATSAPVATTGTAAAATSTGAAPTTTSHTSAPPEVPRRRRHGHASSGAAAASQGAHISTTVIVGRDGKLSPPVVSVPAGVDVGIHVANHSGSPCTVALIAAVVYGTVQVNPASSGKLQTGALRNGTYQILVNGTPRGRIVAGAQGAP